MRFLASVEEGDGSEDEPSEVGSSIVEDLGEKYGFGREMIKTEEGGRETLER